MQLLQRVVLIEDLLAHPLRRCAVAATDLERPGTMRTLDVHTPQPGLPLYRRECELDTRRAELL